MQDSTNKNQNGGVCEEARPEPMNKHHRFAKLSQCGIGQATKHNIKQLQKLNEATFPFKYEPAYYQTLAESLTYSRYGYIGEVIVGSIFCREKNVVDDDEKIEEYSDSTKSLYIVALNVLEPYLRLGVGSELLAYILELASLQPTADAGKKKNNNKLKPFTHVALHVWIKNEVALKFYKLFGFETKRLIENYYNELDPPHAYLIARSLPWCYETGYFGAKRECEKRIGQSIAKDGLTGESLMDDNYDLTLHNVSSAS